MTANPDPGHDPQELTLKQLDDVAGGTSSGIASLVAVSALKAANANQEAQQAAEHQRAASTRMSWLHHLQATFFGS